MFQLTINEKGGATRQESFEKDEVTIGRVQGNDIILPKGNISKRHSRIVLKDGKFIIVDLKSTNGTYVNGKKITAPQVIKTSDKVYIGDFTIQIEDGMNGAEEPPLRAASGPAEEEIDLFGGDAGFDPEPAAPEAPGLIDESFDQEFEPAAPEPALAAEPELELDEDFGAPDADAEPPPLDLDAGFDPEPAPAPRAPSLQRAEPPSLALEPDMEATPPPELDVGPTSMPSPAEPEPAEEPAPVLEIPPAPTGAESAPAATAAVPPAHVASAPAPVAVAAAAEPPLEREAVLALLHADLLEALDLAGCPLEEVPGLEAEAEARAHARLAGLAGRLPADADPAGLAAEAARRATGIGLLADLLADEGVFEVALSPDRRILVDREGRLEPTERTVGSDAEALAAVHALAALGGIAPGDVGPLVDARLRSGARVVAALPPLAFRGPTLSVRKTTRDFFTLEKLSEYDTIDEALLGLLDLAVRHRKNILLSIGPGVTATATMNALLSRATADERIVSAERGVELHLRGHPQAVAFDLCSGVQMTDVLQFAGAAQTERLFVGELGEAEAPAVVDAFGGAFEGGVAALVAGDAAGAVETLVDWVGTHRSGGAAAARAAVARAFPLVLQERKLSDSSRRITEVCELVLEEGEVRLEAIFRFEPAGVDESMMITGRFAPTGRIPRFVEELVERGEAEVDTSVYQA